MIDREFARRFWNKATMAGVSLVVLAVGLMIAHGIVFGLSNNLGFGPFAAISLLAGVAFLAVGCARALAAPRS